jgi:lysophospholipase L1-like esterase
LWHDPVRFNAIAWTTQPLQDSYKPMLAEKLAAYAARLEALVKRTRAMGAEPIFVTQPTHYCRHVNGRLEGVAQPLRIDGTAVNGLDCDRMLREFDLVTLAVGGKHDVTCVDLAGSTAWDDSDFYDYVHMTPSGTRKLGEALFEALKDRLR